MSLTGTLIQAPAVAVNGAEDAISIWAPLNTSIVNCWFVLPEATKLKSNDFITPAWVAPRGNLFPSQARAPALISHPVSPELSSERYCASVQPPQLGLAQLR